MTYLLQNYVADQAQQRPQAIALMMGNDRLTYGELEDVTNRLARLLKDAGCRRGDRVCFLIPKSLSAITSLVGILKADCMHVPLDTSSPAPRLTKIVEACEPRFILTSAQETRLLDEILSDPRLRDAVSVGSMDENISAGENFTPKFSMRDLHAYSAEPLQYLNTGEDPAHILFTSGSTGAPKGVVITHSNVISFLDWANKYFGIDSTDRISGHPPLHFDLSTFDIFGAFKAGARLYPVPPALNISPKEVTNFIRDAELTQWFSVPSILNFMAKFDVVRVDDFPALKRLLWCGEVFPTPGLIYWMKRLPHVQFTNLYGPTEATIASSFYRVSECPDDEKATLPIGTPCEGEDLLVLDANLKPVNEGEAGDLYISGVGLSPGYWRDAEKTNAVFLQNPHGPDLNLRIYKTGDLAKVGDDGLIHYLGRADSQIKSRGYRIELGEIESALHSLGVVEECAVVGVNTEGFEGTAICCAYVAKGEHDSTPLALRKELSRLLPNYMLPTRWRAFARLPQNANGKIDRPRLREHFDRAAGESL